MPAAFSSRVQRFGRLGHGGVVLRVDHAHRDLPRRHRRPARGCRRRRGSARSPRRRCATRRCRSSPWPAWPALPFSSSTVHFIASAYLRPSWNTWPTSMPRAMPSVPLPSGEASPATTLRMSATTSGSGRSRPQLTPARWKPGLVGADHEVGHRRDAAVGDHADRLSSALTGPRKPGSLPRCSGISASVARRYSARPGELGQLDLVDRVVAAHQRQHELRRACVVLAHQRDRLHRALPAGCPAARRRPRRSSAWACRPCASPRRRRRARPAPAPRPARRWPRSREPSENAIASSPESASTWNSCEASPPIAPVSACTARKLQPQAREDARVGVVHVAVLARQVVVGRGGRSRRPSSGTRARASRRSAGGSRRGTWSGSGRS